MNQYCRDRSFYSELIRVYLRDCRLVSCSLFDLLHLNCYFYFLFFFFQAEDGIRDIGVTGVQTCALPISTGIIKLVSLLSAMIYYVQDEGAIVAIDELDIHIFEYLLAMLLEKLSQYAKGQLIFTAHNLLPMEKLQKDSIIISTRNDKHDIEYTYLKGISKTTNLRQKYLKSQRMWSEENIEPLLLNTSALDMYIKKLVME